MERLVDGKLKKIEENTFINIQKSNRTKYYKIPVKEWSLPIHLSFSPSFVHINVNIDVFTLVNVRDYVNESERKRIGTLTNPNVDESERKRVRT